MTAGWVAGTVRAQAMARRVLGADAARQLAACRSLTEAQRMLETTPLRSASGPGLSLDAAQKAIAETMLWDLRVLAGWLPQDGVTLLRLLAGWFEIANVDELLQALAGLPSRPEFQLGALATAWPRLSEARSTTELRQALAASAWGDPGGDTIRDIRAGMRRRWADRVAGSSDRARAWATAAAALASLGGPGPAPQSRPGRPHGAVMAAVPVAEPWQAETDWWRRVEDEGHVLLRSSVTDSGPVLGAVVVMAADARRVRAALASAARGGLALEAYDALV
jgi:ATP synthase (C/AC39) subunit